MVILRKNRVVTNTGQDKIFIQNNSKLTKFGVELMRIRLKLINEAGEERIDHKTTIREVMINEDFINPKNESIALGIRNKQSSGIIEFTIAEVEQLFKEVNSKMHLLKTFNIFGTSGAINMEKKKK
jgi:hypothetical protein